MPGVPEDELLAAELALGVLEFDARARAKARAAWDPGFAALVAAWEERLSGMAEDVPAVPPPPSARRRILRELFGEGPEVVEAPAAAADAAPAAPAPEPAPAPAAPTPIRPSRRREVFAWRALAAACVLVGAVSVIRPDIAPVHFGPVEPAQVRYVALIQGEAGGPGFFAVLDEVTGETLVRQVSGPEPADGVYQMWMANEGAPVSMGLLEGGSQALRMPAELLAPGGGFLPGAHFGVSLEPPGGSPTGAPTDVVATGDPERF
ncbi:anti-sigma factor [Rhodovulum sp. DZ06]|uniref:anti-sigma factor n=1 Tax=Rhodovulum sp. DZ06 TaxID=3425126 RepID=UPI003D3310B9